MKSICQPFPTTVLWSVLATKCSKQAVCNKIHGCDRQTHVCVRRSNFWSHIQFTQSATLPCWIIHQKPECHPYRVSRPGRRARTNVSINWCGWHIDLGCRRREAHGGKVREYSLFYAWFISEIRGIQVPLIQSLLSSPQTSLTSAAYLLTAVCQSGTGSRQ